MTVQDIMLKLFELRTGGDGKWEALQSDERVGWHRAAEWVYQQVHQHWELEERARIAEVVRDDARRESQLMLERNRDLRLEVRALRGAVIDIADGYFSHRDERERVKVLRERANHLAVPFKFDEE